MIWVNKKKYRRLTFTFLIHKKYYIELEWESFLLGLPSTMGLPWPAFFNCSFLPLPLTLRLSPSAYVFCQLSAFFHPLHQVKAWTFPNITHATSLLSSPSQARTSSYFSFTESFGFVIFNSIKKGSLKASKVILIYFSPNCKVFTILQNFFFLSSYN